ncbi:MAG: GntR family transcriptional regulator [Oscillospiraceae bacterium]
MGEWNFSNDRPIYIQLVEKITAKIISGEFECGEKLPSVRDLAADCGVNPNTMQKALSELERMELIFTQRTTGKTVTEDKGRIDSMKKELAAQQIIEFLEKMQKLGFTKEEIISYIKQIQEGNDL